ncbi:MotE family protein [Teichococcus aestuarii]|uniref:MotE family protein n=3 Tax=Teichococcus aestuarii TaxID=568898 RepID=UPI003616D7FD
MTSYPPDLAPSRRRLLGPRLGLPMMALGLAALLPGRISNLMEGPAWPVMPGFSTAFSRSPEAPRPVPEQPVTLREGVIATPNVSSVLAAPVRANPLGEERPGEARLLAEVMRRQAEIDRRERSLEAREARLQAADAMARAQIAELIRLRTEIEQLVVRESTAAEADIDALVALYVNMRPQQAAKVLERLEPPRAAIILLKIPERQAGPIMAQMEPPAALAVTQEIAGRREAFRTPQTP